MLYRQAFSPARTLLSSNAHLNAGRHQGLGMRSIARSFALSQTCQWLKLRCTCALHNCRELLAAHAAAGVSNASGHSAEHGCVEYVCLNCRS